VSRDIPSHSRRYYRQWDSGTVRDSQVTPLFPIQQDKRWLSQAISPGLEMGQINEDATVFLETRFDVQYGPFALAYPKKRFLRDIGRAIMMISGEVERTTILFKARGFSNARLYSERGWIRERTLLAKTAIARGFWQFFQPKVWQERCFRRTKSGQLQSKPQDSVMTVNRCCKAQDSPP